MSAETNYTTIKAALDALSLREIPNLHNVDEVKESHNQWGYILQPTGTDETEFASSGIISTFEWKLEILFKHVNSLERVRAFDTFNNIKQVLQQISGFLGFLGNSEFGRLADFTFISVGTINFQFGVEGSC